MSHSPTFDTVADILHSGFDLPRDRLRPEAALGDLGLDSLPMLEFIFSLEDAFQMNIPEGRLDPRAGAISLAQLCGLIDELRGHEGQLRVSEP